MSVQIMDSGLRGKKALITGGGTGIGLAIAVALAREGANVAIASRNPSPEAQDTLKSFGVNAIAISADVSDEQQVNRMVKEAITGLGGLDCYINNAANHWDEPVTRLTAEGLDKSINTNLTSCIYACREVSRHFIAQKSGSILIIGSAATWGPLYKETGYRVSKVGLVGYMGVLAIELAPFGIRVNMLTPGFFPTKLSSHLANETMQKILENIPLRRAGNVVDLGPSAILLLSDKLSPFTIGAELVVDGGQILRPLPFYSDEEIVRMNRD